MMVISIKSSFLLYYSNLISVISLCIFLTLYCYDISSRNQIYSHFIKLFITCFLTSILSSSFQYVFSHHYLTVAPLCAFFFFSSIQNALHIQLFKLRNLLNIILYQKQKNNICLPCSHH